jgi:hypothetical protein
MDFDPDEHRLRQSPCKFHGLAAESASVIQDPTAVKLLQQIPVEQRQEIVEILSLMIRLGPDVGPLLDERP